jgi:uncharacterized membrane protein
LGEGKLGLKKNNNFWINIGFLLPLIMAALLHASSEIAFFYKKNLFYVFFAIASLTIFSIVVYWGFVKKDIKGRSDWSLNLQRKETKIKKIALIAFAIVFLPAFSAFLGFLFTTPPAYPCSKLASEKFSKKAIVSDINHAGRTPGVFVRLSLHFEDDDYSGTLKLRKSAIDSQNINSGDSIFIHGRSCAFGYVVDSVISD